MDTDGLPVPRAGAGWPRERFALDHPTEPGTAGPAVGGVPGPLAIGGPGLTAADADHQDVVVAAEPDASTEEDQSEVVEAEVVEVEPDETIAFDDSGDARRRRNIVAAMVIAGVAMAAAVIVVLSARDKPQVIARSEGRPMTITGHTDTFDRVDDATSLTGPGSLPWTVGAGTFGIVGNQAFAGPQETSRSLAVVNLGRADGGASVRVSTLRTNAGLVFRYRDPKNYWAVLAIREYASWAIVHLVNGRQVVVANTGLSTVSDGTLVGVRLRGSVVDIALNGTVVRTVSDPTPKGSFGVGITAMGPGPDVALFEDFTATTP